MYKKKYNFKSTVRRIALGVLSGAFVLSLGFGAACADDTKTEDDDKEPTKVTDTQTILNGNFEFFDDSKDKTHIIYTPDSWTVTASGNTNYVMNGIIDTSASGWARLTDADLAGKLDENNELDEDDEDYEDNYVDYNGMRSRDIVYANPHTALRTDAKEGDKQLIANPLTHNVVTDGTTSSYVDENGEQVTLYKDENGNYFTDEAMTEPYDSHVLMIHNYYNSKLTVKNEEDGVYDYDSYGTAQKYASSSTVTLAANTAAELSVWVKTSNLMYDRNGAVPTAEDGIGAYISVTQTVGGTAIDAFQIDGINTEGVTENNGWVQFRIFVNGCDFASSTIKVELGLGKATDSGDYSEVVEGYAFFDDLTCKQYVSLEDSENYTKAEAAGEFADTTCYLTDKDDGKIFTYGEHLDDSNYLIDLAVGGVKSATRFDGNVVAGLTADNDRYVTSTSVPSFFGVDSKAPVYGTDVFTNYNIDINTSNDVVAAFNISNLSSQLSSAAGIGGISKYSNVISNALSSAANLPGATDETTALMILSAEGAAYTAEISGIGNSFTVEADSNSIVSFWVKTSDMTGADAATIELYDVDDKDNVVSITADTTDEKFDLNDEKDIYDGWVQCFFYVENPLDSQKTFGINFIFGETVIKDTAIADYTPGYVAMTNVQITDVEDEDIFELAAAGTFAQSFSFDTEKSNSDNNFDDVYSSLSNAIKENIVSRPSSYNGTNGASASIIYKDEIDPDGYDKRNDNAYSGLVNKEYFGNYFTNANAASEGFEWLDMLLQSNGMDRSIINTITADEVWNRIFGNESVQPLLIVNAVRQIGETAAMNYGYIADSNTTVSSSSYQAISVKVKVSAGAVAYVYLTDSNDLTKVSTFDLPDYSFWYDRSGNVLDGEPDANDKDYDEREHIVYFLREDGLYEDREGNLFANLYNYSREYYNDAAEYFEKDAAEPTNFADLDNDKIYYVSAEEAAKENGMQADHYLVATNADGSTSKVFRFENGEYRYIITNTDEDGNATITYSEEPVSNFVIGEGGVELRYDYSDVERQLFATVDARYDANGVLFGGANPEDADLSKLGYDKNGNFVAGKWQTVNFFIHSGDESETYRLELWSGDRSMQGVVEGNGGTFVADPVNGSVPGSYIIFDYSAVSVDSSSYESITSEYEQNIIDEYIALFDEKDLIAEGTVSDAERNIAYFEELFNNFVAEGSLDEADRPAGYEAMYYTYSLYDDAGYIPFNADTAAEGETGYVYNSDDYAETLAYFTYRDNENNSTNVFADYSATKVSVELNISTDNNEDDSTTDNSTENDSNVWLLIASIILAVVLIFVLLSLFLRDLLKKRAQKNARKHTERNVYSGKRKHYIRKLGLADESEESEDAQTPAETDGMTEETPAETTEEATEETAGEAPAEESADGEEAPEDAAETEGQSEVANEEQSEDENK